jgi:hypothetical protein
MPTYVIQHRHAPQECRHAFAAWKGFDSPLRGHPALSTCARGNHSIWWTVEAADPPAALALLPDYVAQRSEATEVKEVQIP